MRPLTHHPGTVAGWAEGRWIDQMCSGSTTAVSLVRATGGSRKPPAPPPQLTFPELQGGGPGH
eukprot:3995740-Pyramimonas_sp.AAC.1